MTMRAWAVGLAFLVATVVAAGAAPPRVRAKDPALARLARGVPAGGRLRVDGLRLDGRGVALDLERFEVWAPDAEVWVGGVRRNAPETAYFRGTVAGEPDSLVFLAVRSGDAVGGLVFRGGAYHSLGRARRSGALRARKVDLSSVEGVPFGCETDALPAVPQASALVMAERAVAAASSAAYTARIAVETDYEYFAKFGSAGAALDYMGDLIGYASVVYAREVNTSLVISWSRLWTGGAASDPWTVTSGTSGALNEFLTYWRANMGGVDRTVAHMLSGKGLGGGIAYLSVLCDQQYGYGLSGNIDGSFSWDGDATHDPANVVWDIIVVSHELGHNFSSPHTHDYCNYGGNVEPVDRCYQGCAGTGTGLPACTATPTAFGGGKGTIMSYCHLLSGGYRNIAMTFGQGHPCGEQPDRVAAQMRAHVVQRAASFPSCLAPAATCGNGVVEAGEVCEPGVLGGATCATFGCTGGTLACNDTCGDYDLGACTGCPPCDRDGVCEAGEDCAGCPGDCPGGTTSGAVCGNGVCEAGNGEDCVACPADCAGVQSGKPSGRWCCGAGGGAGPVPCSDARCTANGRVCTTVPSVPDDYCCGDGACTSGESCSTCRLDCTLGAELCTGLVDEDCDGAIDCADGQCSTHEACQATCAPSGAACTANAECCSQACVTKGKKRKCQ
ncbi:MAG TPA: M12 family metallo-peptidase [Candidatus Limnocylindria bacterium]|nr:M12 family metallo-peptidase [Candidatus Limnocylindria bacterium]